MAAERTATPNIVTSGGTGFGILSIIVASHRGWITRKDAVKHLTKMWLILSLIIIIVKLIQRNLAVTVKIVGA